MKQYTDKVQLMGSNVIQPVDVQTRYSETIQTHNAVSVGANGATTQVEVGTKGYSKTTIAHSSTGNASAYVKAILSNGTVVNSAIVGTSSSTGDVVFFDLNGIEKLQVYGLDTSGATNAITIEVSLMA